MARIYPESIEQYNPTYSEKVVFDCLKNQLDDNYYVFYSISWIYNNFGVKEQSEVDFLVFDPRYGYLCIEVKGGQSIRIEDNVWYIKESNSERKLKRSPFEQAEASMRYFLDYYAETYNFNFKGIFGAMVFFPNFQVPDGFGNRPKELLVTSNEMFDLEKKIRKAFIFWKNKNKSVANLSDEQQKNFIQLVQKKIALSAAAGSLIQYKTKQFEVINRVQENFIYFIKNINQFYIKGVAGTGKTLIGLKLAIEYSQRGLKTIFVCYNKYLANYISRQLSGYNVDIISIEEFVSLNDNFDVIQEKKLEISLSKYHKMYDSIIVDEAQDLSEEMAFLIRTMLKDDIKSYLCILFDDTQNLYDRNFSDAFIIDIPPFLLRENLRNTSSIYSWATDKSNLGKDVVTNPIQGPEPISRIFNDLESYYNYLEILLNELVYKENVALKSIVILVDDSIYENLNFDDKLNFNVTDDQKSESGLRIIKVSNFKGLESDVIIYTRSNNYSQVRSYIAYTRARFYLYEYILNNIF